MNECCVDSDSRWRLYYSFAMSAQSHRYWEGLHENLRLAPTVYAGWRVGAAARLG